MSLTSIFSRKNMNLIVGLLSLLIALWVVMFAVPSLFVSLFDTLLGNLILVSFIGLAFMYDMNFAIGLSIVFIVLWRFSHMSGRFLI
jgi:hypothetical protein